MQVASFALVHYHNPDKGISYNSDRGILFTNEHKGKFGKLLPGGRLNDLESEMYRLDYRPLATLDAVRREVNEELKCLFVPNMRFIKHYSQRFQDEDGEAWYYGGTLYSYKHGMEFPDGSVLYPQLSLKNARKIADEDISPLEVLGAEQIKKQVKFESMIRASLEYLEFLHSKAAAITQRV